MDSRRINDLMSPIDHRFTLNRSNPMIATKSFALSKTEIEQFHKQGYLGPYTAFTPEEMADYRAKIEAVVKTEGPNKKNPSQCRHLDSPVVFDLCSSPAIVDRMRSLYGNDL